ncbi:hypothetical protein LCGC14_1870220 [marine sediment metagenome]|uniref:Uncharacterized protein n=1 Tax=marine sediment metagenome TaxID=412755 RepID=A0A0F9GTB9_9ZZZZ
MCCYQSSSSCIYQYVCANYGERKECYDKYIDCLRFFLMRTNDTREIIEEVNKDGIVKIILRPRNKVDGIDGIV